MEPLRPDELIWNCIIQGVALFALIACACFGAQVLGRAIAGWVK